MKKVIAGTMAALMAVTSIAATATPASAQWFRNDDSRSPVTVERDRGNWGDWNDRRFERRGDYYYYNGHRGSREWRRGWREYNGYWFPLAAFAAGAIIGGAVSNQNNYDNRPVRITRDHLVWCENQYRSYRASDNTFQPYNGARQQCISPYMR